MPRDLIDISITSSQRSARKFGELDDQKDPIRLRVGSGPAGAEGKEGKEGKEGPAGSEIPIKRGMTEVTINKGAEFSAEIEVEHGLSKTPTSVQLTTDGKNVGASLPPTAWLVGAPGATKFKFQIKINGTAATTTEAKKVPVYWEAC